MKRKLSTVVFGIIFLIGFGVLSYPTVSNQWNTYRQSKLISTYEETVSTFTAEDFSAEWEAARAFNATITQNNIFADVFGEDTEDTEDSEYRQVLNVAGNDVMGYISIPKINIEIPIYHGTSELVLQNGAGHLNGTSLPIGGDGTHAVLAAHRALPSAKLFTDIDKLETGDVFYIHVLDETLAYQVDQILPMVDKDDMETLESALAIEDGKDYVTLFTCTPYGVNTHRLLVRGTRIPYDGSEDETPTVVGSMVKAVTNYYMLFMIMGIAVTILIILLLRFLFRRKQPKS
jgi:sortase A